MITVDERKQVARFKQAERRNQALVARAMVRRALSWRFGDAPENWRFERNDQGRPRVKAADGLIDFNLSHTEGCVVCAIAEGGRVGVDVESVARAGEIEEVRDRIFSVQEKALLRRLPAERCGAVRLWTLKEAYSKALGQGLGADFQNIEFGFDEQFSVVNLTNASVEWRFGVYDLGERFIASIAHNGGGAKTHVLLRDAVDLL